MEHHREKGFTLIEMMIVLAAIVPILMAILGATKTVRSTINTSVQLADLTANVDRAIDRVGRLMQKAVVSSIRTRALQADVDVAVADPLNFPTPPILGEWITPIASVDRSSLRFDTISGFLSMNASATVGPFELEFIIDPGEVTNGSDDDGDGFIDEGQFRFRTPDAEVALLPRVENITLLVDGSLVQVLIRAVGKDAQRRIHRVLREKSFHIRNT